MKHCMHIQYQNWSSLNFYVSGTQKCTYNCTGKSNFTYVCTLKRMDYSDGQENPDKRDTGLDVKSFRTLKFYLIF